MSINVQNLSKIFGEQKAVNQISFDIQPGNIVGFLGPNGAGKSTTMKMLTTFITPSSGSAKVCGFDIVKNAMEVRKSVGYLPEKNPLYYDMYVKEFLYLAAEIHRLGSLKKSRVDEMIQITGLEKEVKKKIGSLSKGYKQRVGLAQAMIHYPQVLILDEPTSGLDPNQIADIRELILNIGKERTVLLSTHIMQEVTAMCNRVIIINNGQIIADDDIENIATSTPNISNKNATLIVEFDKEINVHLLNELTHLISVEVQNPKTFLLTTHQPEQLRKDLMRWSLDNDIDIISLHALQQSLEDAFRNLTKGNS